MPRPYQHYPRDLRSKPNASSHHRKRKSEHVPRIDDAPKRRRTRQDKGNVSRPISFKELEQISRQSSPALKLISKAERFEALLVSEKLSNEESNPEFLKLVISAFHLLCSANNLIAENVDGILRSPAAENFIAGTVLSSFINEMPHANHWKDENDRFCTVSNLTVIFVTFLQKFGKDLVYKLPLAQLSTSLKELKEMNLVQDIDHLDEKIQQLEELRNEAIRCAKFANDQKSQGEPPENFRELSVIPQVEDLISRPFLRENITDRRFKDLDHYLDVQFRLLREDMFFIDHQYIEESGNQSHSHVNEHEAKFLVALCRYLLQQGYKADQITLLTTYTRQMYAIRDCLQEEDAIRESLRAENDPSVGCVRVTTVDNFQGEENDIILLSLVRSNKDEKVGFIKIVNRACVALSRARKGFYCIGNFGLLLKHSDIWKKIVTDLKASSSIGNVLPVVCQIHNDEISVKTAEDFNTKVPKGGCQRPCAVRLKCGHACTLECHPCDRDHVEFRCQKPCRNKRARCDHTCPKRCWEVCEQNCEIKVEKQLPICGHTMLVRCDTNPERIKCQKRCEKDLPCGHRCQRKCRESCTKKCLEIVKKTDWLCGHLASIACSATLLFGEKFHSSTLVLIVALK